MPSKIPVTGSVGFLQEKQQITVVNVKSSLKLKNRISH